MRPSEPTPSRSPDAFDGLLVHLQAAELTVGISTVLRLRVLFGSEGLPNEPERVANMVAAVVAHNPAELDAARRATEAWLRQRPAPQAAAGPVEADPPPIASPAAPQGRGRLAPALLAALIVLLGGALVWWSVSRTPLTDAINGLADLVTPDPVADGGVPYDPKRIAPRPAVEFLASAPRLEIRAEAPTAPERTRWPFVALACFAAGVALYGWRRTRPPGEPVPPTGPTSPPRRHRRPANRASRFVTGRDAETLAWGIGRFLSDEPTPRLDLPRTVRATVSAGGAPHLLWARAKQHREIWLWVDDSATRAHPEMDQLVVEVQRALARVGLRPRVARFWGIPDQLSEDGEPIRIDQLEDARTSARVAVLTDGRLWTRLRSEPARRREAESALRRIAGWRQLAVIDFADGAWPIAEHLDRFGIAQRQPAELIGWLGEFDVRINDTAEDDRIAWAAACALCPEPVSEDDALALLHHLAPADVDASPWAIRELREEAPGPGRRLRWTAAQRAELLSWLGTAEAGPNSLLSRARDFWRARLDGDDPRRRAQRAWLDLFAGPGRGDGPLERAIAALLPLTHADDEGHLPVAVGDRVRQSLPADLAGTDAIRLPWRWADLDLHSRLRARAIGLGKAVGGLPEERVVRPGRVGLAAGLAAGVALAALVLALWPDEQFEPSARPVVVEKPADVEVMGPTRGQGWGLSAKADWDAAMAQGIPAGAEVRIGTRPVACVERIDADTLLLRCATRPKPARVNARLERQGETWIHRNTLAFIESDPGGTRWQRLAAELLDTGSVDVVIVARRLGDAGLIARLKAQLADAIPTGPWAGLMFVARTRADAARRAHPGWLIVTGADRQMSWDRLTGKLGDGEPTSPAKVYGLDTDRAPGFRVRGRAEQAGAITLVRGVACPGGTEPLSVASARERQAEACDALGERGVAALADGGVMEGKDYGCRISADGASSTQQILCAWAGRIRPFAGAWRQQLEADSASLERPDSEAEAVLRALVRVPDDLVWRGDIPIVWALVRARNDREFQQAIDARIARVHEVMAKRSVAERTLVKSYLEALRRDPELANLWKGTTRRVASDTPLDGLSARVMDELAATIKQRLPGWRVTALRGLSQRLYAANQAVIGEFPFAVAKQDASRAGVERLLRAIGAVRALPVENPYRSDAGRFLGKKQGDWAQAFEDFVRVHDQIGTWPVPVRQSDQGRLRVEVSARKGDWRVAEAWDPGEAARACAGERCQTFSGDWALLRLIDALSRTDRYNLRQSELMPTIQKLTGKGDLGCAVGTLREGRCVGWIQLGRSKAHFVPRAIDLLPLQDSPGVPMVKPVGPCPYTCQLQGYPAGDRMESGMCLCQDDASVSVSPLQRRDAPKR